MVTVITDMLHVTVVTMTYYNSDSDKRCNNRGDSHDSHVLWDGSDNDLQ